METILAILMIVVAVIYGIFHPNESVSHDDWEQ